MHLLSSGDHVDAYLDHGASISHYYIVKTFHDISSSAPARAKGSEVGPSGSKRSFGAQELLCGSNCSAPAEGGVRAANAPN
jgi:hypothetical protein